MRIFHRICRSPLKTIGKGRYSTQKLTLYSDGAGINRIILGEPEKKLPVEKWDGSVPGYGGIIGEKGTADVTFHPHNGELHANIAFIVPDPHGRIGMIKDALVLAHDFAKERGAERVVVHAECNDHMNPVDGALSDACHDLGWHCIRKWKTEEGKEMGDFGVYW